MLSKPPLATGDVGFSINLEQANTHMIHYHFHLRREKLHKTTFNSLGIKVFFVLFTQLHKIMSVFASIASYIPPAANEVDSQSVLCNDCSFFATSLFHHNWLCNTNESNREIIFGNTARATCQSTGRASTC